MTAMMNELIGDSFASLPASPASCPAEDGGTPVLTVTVNDQTVLTIVRRLHDGTCIDGVDCDIRDFHALDAYEDDVKNMLGAMVSASTDGDSPELSTCRSTTERRWLHGKWWCKTCNIEVRYMVGSGWVHTTKKRPAGSATA
ncbi:hypothetical protein Achl_4025 (plasmid) [Pseudarthrobacter chlorophenolicus A6]|uniref:Uncharacterized protein n=1 Tax=Pseudarthrobacter chlorophenolicus (strain ATCC 700700 / DSM 12829 / CIP 107037 / JCM 12360 / KCTC 9906 / NCIMB 13794 / A6) TaxID=452863 RepID=B8HHS9_PSECP|nr:hypothetical protein [Pseudarthrobacter chlorophenolicus]ACL41976.1 hypothetical protein Achl_4025 [Pseudarthrobacter chlorophenolicus A6]SDQ19741.1 hypothetical protein SAMN04489738_0676 [Pseudarthrobacter chlorophenolicus]